MPPSPSNASVHKAFSRLSAPATALCKQGSAGVGLPSLEVLRVSQQSVSSLGFSSWVAVSQPRWVV